MARTRQALVVVQVMLSFVLLVCAGLMLQSLRRLLSVDPGFKTANVLSMRISLDWTKYAKRAQLNQFFHQVLDRVSGMPGVDSAAVSMTVPLNSTSSSSTVTAIHSDFRPLAIRWAVRTRLAEAGLGPTQTIRRSLVAQV